MRPRRPGPVPAGVHLTDPENAWITLRSSTSSAADRCLAQRTRHDNNNRLAELLQNFDLLLTPTTPGGHMATMAPAHT